MTTNHQTANTIRQRKTYLPTHFLLGAVHILVIFMTPFALGFGAIRSMMALDFPAIEYQRIAPDEFGWSDEDRLEHAGITLSYLRSGEPVEIAINAVAKLEMPSEPGVAFYSERELQHMIDVKHLTDLISTLFVVNGIGVLFGFFVLALRLPRVLPDVILQAGWVTIMLVSIFGMLILTLWEFFFATFHKILFPAGSYTFEWTDSLIRLFPPRFWMDFGLLTIGLVLGAAIGLAVIGEWLKSKCSTIDSATFG